MTFLNWLFAAWSINMQRGGAGYARWTLTHCPKNAKNFYKIPAVNQLWLPWLFSASLKRQKWLTTLAKQVLVVFLSHVYSLHFDGQASALLVNYDLRHMWNSHEFNWHRCQQVKCVATVAKIQQEQNWRIIRNSIKQEIFKIMRHVKWFLQKILEK